MTVRFMGRSLAFMMGLVMLVLVLIDGLITPTDIVSATNLITKVVIVMGFSILLAVVSSSKED